MIYARQPAGEERRELQHMIRQAVGRVSQRAQLILLSAQHHSVPELGFEEQSPGKVRQAVFPSTPSLGVNVLPPPRSHAPFYQ